MKTIKFTPSELADYLIDFMNNEREYQEQIIKDLKEATKWKNT